MAKVHFSGEEREKYATVHTKKKEKFPIKSEQSAENALKLLNRAKPPLSSEQKANVRRRAASYGVTGKSQSGKKAK